MITVEVDPDTSIAILKPQGLLTSSDFETVKGIIDPYIDEAGRLNGLIVHARKFPGWESFKDLSSHLKFSRDQHEHVPRVAVVSDSALNRVRQTLSEHFPRAEIRIFAFQDLEKAKRWIAQAKIH